MLVWCAFSAYADQSLQTLIDRGEWREAQSRIYETLWARQPRPDILISMAHAGFLELAIERAETELPYGKSYALIEIARQNAATLTISQREDLLNKALQTAKTPVDLLDVAVAWSSLVSFKQAIELGRQALLSAREDQHIGRMIDILNFKADRDFVSLLAPEIQILAKSGPGDVDPHVYIGLAQLLGLAGDKNGMEHALRLAELHLDSLSSTDHIRVRVSMAKVALRSDRPMLAKTLVAQKYAKMEWAQYYADQHAYKRAEYVTRGMSDGLYVSPREESLENIIRTAVFNGDINTASEMNDNLIKIQSSYVKLQVIIGQAYANTGKKAEATTAYIKATARYLRLEDANYSEYDAELLAQLAHAARLNGDQRLSEMTTSMLPTIISRMLPQNTSGQISARIYFAAMLTEAGDRPAAMSWLSKAAGKLDTEGNRDHGPSHERLELRLAEGLEGVSDLELNYIPRISSENSSPHRIP